MRSYGGASNEEVYKITTENQSNVIVSGYFYSDTGLDPGLGVVTFPVSGDDDCFIQKLNSSGNLVRVRQIGGPTLENTYDVYCNLDVAVYVVGDFFDTVNFDPGSGVFNLTSAGNNDIFTLKLNSAGEFVWVYKIGANFSKAGYAIHMDSDKNVYTTETFSINVDFNSTSGVQFSGSAQVFDVFTLKIGQSCNFLVISTLNLSNTSVCVRENITVEVNGQLNGATEWVLSVGNCLAGTSQTSIDGVFQITSTETATYFVREI
ncbi:MAG: hypothetical protein ACK4GL_05490 [Flavobacteriales bacterium]